MCVYTKQLYEYFYLLKLLLTSMYVWRYVPLTNLVITNPGFKTSNILFVKIITNDLR